MEEFLRNVESIIQTKLILINETTSISSSGKVPEKLTYQDIKHKSYSNFEGFNIYPIEKDGITSFLAIKADKYKLTNEIKIITEAIKDKIQSNTFSAEEIDCLVKGKVIDLSLKLQSEINDKLPLYVGIIDDCGSNEQDIIEIFKMTMDTVVIAPYNNRIFVMFKDDDSTLYDNSNSFLQNVLGDLLVQCSLYVGGAVESLNEVGMKYIQAVKLLKIRNKYDIKDNILIFDNIFDYIIVDGLDDETKDELVKNIFTSEMEKFLNDEMKTTIEEFFRNNLNITETANKLYIHRNTLIYRLDKIYKLTGFDLRVFHHSAIFQLAYIAWKGYCYENRK